MKELIKLHILKYLKNLKFFKFDANILKQIIQFIPNITYLNYTKVNNFYLSNIRFDHIPIEACIFTSRRDIIVPVFPTYKKLIIHGYKNTYIGNISANIVFLNKSLNTLTAISSHFLHGSKFTFVDLTLLNNVVTIGNSFLEHNNLTEINLTPLNKLYAIGSGFLMKNKLKTINLLKLLNLNNIPPWFLACNKLISIDLFSLINVTTIGSHFLAENELTEIDLTPLVGVTVIHSNFLKYNRISDIDLSKLKSIKSIDSFGFLSNNLISYERIMNLEKKYRNIFTIKI